MTPFDQASTDAELVQFRLDPAGTLQVSGEIDLSNAHQLRSALDHATRLDAPTVIDMSGVSFLDSTGLNTLMEYRLSGARLTILHPSPQVARLLDLTAAHQVFDVELTS